MLAVTATDLLAQNAATDDRLRRRHGLPRLPARAGRPFGPYGCLAETPAASPALHGAAPTGIPERASAAGLSE